MAAQRVQEIIVDVGGMTCENCERHVAEALRRVPGVIAAKANRSEGQAIVTADPRQATPERLRSAVEEAGYEPGEVRFVE